jgi:hypothetical protein
LSPTERPRPGLFDTINELRPLFNLSELGNLGLVIGVCLILAVGTGVGAAITAMFPSPGPTSPNAVPLSRPAPARALGTHRTTRPVRPTASTTTPVTTPAPPPSTSSTTAPVRSPVVSASSPPPQTPPPFSWTSPSTVSGLGGPLISIDCPTASLCLAGDSAGDLAWSTNPPGGPGAWAMANVAGQHPITAISCPTTTLCVAADQKGVVVSTSPTWGQNAWTQDNLQGVGGWTGVSCPLPTLCVAVGKGVIATSVTPSSGAWTVVPAPNDADFPVPDPLSSVSCPTALFCVAVGALGMVYVSTNPTTGTGSWKGTKTDYFSAQICQQCTNQANSLVGVSCPTPSLCAAIDPIGDVVTSTDPGATVPNWTITAVNSAWLPLKFVTCLSSTFCLAGSHFSPAPSMGIWMDAGYLYASNASCPSVASCVVVLGNQVTTGTYTG